MKMPALSRLEIRLLIAIGVCMVVLVVVLYAFFIVKESAENPVPANMRTNSELLPSGQSDPRRSGADVDVDAAEAALERAFKRDCEAQKGLGTMQSASPQKSPLDKSR